MRIFFKPALVGLTLIMAGAGCAQQPSVSEPSVAEEVVADTNDIRSEKYSLEVDDAYQVSDRGERIRIQNFEGSDDPKTVYPDEAFFIEISDVGDAYTSADLEEDYAQVTNRTLSSRAVLFGAGGIVRGDMWQHEAYFDDLSNTFIVISANALPGNDLGQDVVSQIQWNE